VIILGLTGSIGMGKSTAAAMLRRLGVPLFDADAEVHRLLGRGGAAVREVEAAFPGVRGETGHIDRFVAQALARHEPLIVLDIPLLFETRGTGRCDYVLVVSAPARLQRERVMRRRGMTARRFGEIIGAQLPDSEKRRCADFVVLTALSKAATLRRLHAIVAELRYGKRPRRRGLARRRRR
jgi:dephospho-CoA kinase